jgi:hypothetical protein
MANKQVSEGLEFFDGRPVEKYRGKFSAPFDLDPETGLGIDSGSQVTFIVTARCQTPRFKDAPKSGELIRENTFKVEAVVPVSSDEAKFLLDNMGELVEGVNEGLIESQIVLDFYPKGADSSLQDPSDLFGSNPLVDHPSPLDGTMGPSEREEDESAPKAVEPWRLIDQPMFDLDLKPTFKVVEI